MAVLYLRIDMLFAHPCLQQFGIVAFGPLVQLFTGRIERQARKTGEHADSPLEILTNYSNEERIQAKSGRKIGF